MALDEWEVLPRDGFLDYYEEGGKRSFAASERSSNSKSLFKMDYFNCPSSPPKDSRFKDPEDEKTKEVIKEPIRVIEIPSVIMPEARASDVGSKETDQDLFPDQISFKKMKDHEFVDTLFDSPKPCSKGFVPPQMDAGMFNFGDKNKTEACKGDQAVEIKIGSPRIENEIKENMKEEVTWEENSGWLNLWKWSMNGIGAICSFGVAAATICIIILGNHQRNKQQQQKENLKIQIYTDDKAGAETNGILGVS